MLADGPVQARLDRTTRRRTDRGRGRHVRQLPGVDDGLAGGGGKAGALVDRATAELLLGADYGLNMEVVDCVKTEPST